MILVSTIYYEYLTGCIEIYKDGSTIFVHNNGLWIPLPDMTIHNVITSLGFINNNIMSSCDMNLYVSCAPSNIITIANRKYYKKYDTIKPKGCIQHIMSKIETFIL